MSEAERKYELFRVPTEAQAASAGQHVESAPHTFDQLKGNLVVRGTHAHGGVPKMEL